MSLLAIFACFSLVQSPAWLPTTHRQRRSDLRYPVAGKASLYDALLWRVLDGRVQTKYGVPLRQVAGWLLGRTCLRFGAGVVLHTK